MPFRPLCRGYHKIFKNAVYATSHPRRAFVRFQSVTSPSSTEPVKSSHDDIVIPELVTGLEWVLEAPFPVHQFLEPPVRIL